MKCAIRPLVIAILLSAILSGNGAFDARPAMAQGCDPSYPGICLPSAPDLDCADIGHSIRVIYNPAIGAYDPHFLDPDFSGTGCELS